MSSNTKCCNPGDRIPSVWVHNGHKRVYVYTSMGNGQDSFYYPLNLNEWFHIEILQFQQGTKVRL